MTAFDEAYALKAERFATRPSSLSMLERLLAELDLHGGASVLDIGCSTGIALRVMSKAGLAAHGIDVNEAAVNLAVDRGLYAEPYDGVNLPHGCKDFDAVIITTVLSHVESPALTLRLAWQALTPGGQLGILNPNRTHHLVNAPGRMKNGYKSDPTIRQRFSRSSLSSLIKLAGFVDVRSGFLGRPSFRFIRPHMWLVARKPWEN